MNCFLFDLHISEASPDGSRRFVFWIAINWLKSSINQSNIPHFYAPRDLHFHCLFFVHAVWPHSISIYFQTRFWYPRRHTAFSIHQSDNNWFSAITIIGHCVVKRSSRWQTAKLANFIPKAAYTRPPPRFTATIRKKQPFEKKTNLSVQHISHPSDHIMSSSTATALRLATALVAFGQAGAIRSEDSGSSVSRKKC